MTRSVGAVENTQTRPSAPSSTLTRLVVSTAGEKFSDDVGETDVPAHGKIRTLPEPTPFVATTFSTTAVASAASGRPVTGANDRSSPAPIGVVQPPVPVRLSMSRSPSSGPNVAAGPNAGAGA